jgi:predicted PurR-regulated permease PerM
MNPDRERVARRFFTVLLIASTVLVALVARPLATALFLAAVLAGSLWPLQMPLARALGRRRSWAAVLLCLGVVVLILGPLVAFSTFLVKEIAEAVKWISETFRSEGVEGLRGHLPDALDRALTRVIDWLSAQSGGDLDATVQRQVTAQGGKAVVAVSAAVSATGSLLFQATMMVIALYFFLVQGDEVVAWLDRIAPLPPGQTKELLAEFKKVTYAVIVSTIITAGVQALAALVGYLIARVPNPVFFSGLTFFIAFIPAIGAAAVCLAAAVLLFFTGHPYMALFLAIWGVVVVGLVDNVVKPYLIKAGMELRGAVVFFALIGGLGAFGTVGLLLGPLVVAAFLALIRMYERDFNPHKPGPADGGEDTVYECRT